MRELAHGHGGKCMTEKYVNVTHELFWRCKKGHIWGATPEQILRGRWCPKCKKARLWRERLEKLRAVAKLKGGECLTSEYTGNRDKLLWRCAKGHFWQARADTILRSWCPTCGVEKRKKSLSDFQALAAKRGGRCLSTKYIASHQKMFWQCEKGHLWETTGHRVQLGAWCPVCVRLGSCLTIELMREIAQSRGGLCLSKEYVNAYTKLNWQCHLGHVWAAAPSHIRSGRWCPVCARRSHINRTIEDMRKLAHERGGRCLSEEYRGNIHKLTWQCKLGHVWETTPETVRRGSWCPECYYLSMCLSDEARKKYLSTGKM